MGKKIWVLLLVAFAMSLTNGVFAATVNLPQTGQTKCYNAAGAEIACSGTGQDGEKLQGVISPTQRFTVSGSCVTDSLTGLMWSKDGNLPVGSKTWQQSLDYVASINSGGGLCGYTDWRLPNVNELLSLVNFGQSNTATWLNTQGFLNVQAGYYWSSSAYAGATNNAWRVYMWDGSVGADGKGNSNYVWPVRAGQ